MLSMHHLSPFSSLSYALAWWCWQKSQNTRQWKTVQLDFMLLQQHTVHSLLTMQRCALRVIPTLQTYSRASSPIGIKMQEPSHAEAFRVTQELISQCLFVNLLCRLGWENTRQLHGHIKCKCTCNLVILWPIYRCTMDLIRHIFLFMEK